MATMEPTAAEPEIATYGALKQTFQAAVSQLTGLLSHGAWSPLAQRLAPIADKLARNRFHLAVLGQFKRGKTTFVNGLIGADLLPTGVVPLTSIVTLIEYGEQAGAVVHFRNHQTKAISIREVVEYVTERDNPQNRKDVARVEVTYPAAILRDGVVLIDTPGIGSTYEHNTDVAYQFLPQVDAAIFVASVDPPLSQAEKDFLIAIREYAAKLFLILNKIDYVSETERRELLEFLHTVLATEIGIVEPKIFPLSAKRALAAALHGGEDGGLPAFRATLDHFLLHEKGRVALTAAAGAALRLTAEARFLLEVEKRALATPLEELEEKLAEFDRLRARAEQEHRDFQHLLKAEAQQLMNVLDEELAVLRTQEVPVLEAELHAFADSHPELKGRTLAYPLQDELKRVLIDHFEGWRRAKEQRLDADFRGLSGRFVDAANQIIARVVELSAALFNLPSVPLASVEGLSAESRLYYMVGEEPILLSIEPIYFSTLLPGYFTRHFVMASALKHVPIEAERNCGRLRYDLLTRIEQSVDRFGEHLAERIRLTLDSIRRAIEAGTVERAQSGAQAEARQAAIDGQLAALAAVDARLDAIRTQAANL